MPLRHEKCSERPFGRRNVTKKKKVLPLSLSFRFATEPAAAVRGAVFGQSQIYGQL